jgi:hypothetical protein
VVAHLKQLGRDGTAAKLVRLKGQVEALMDQRRKVERGEAMKLTEKEQQTLLSSLATAMSCQVAVQVRCC